MRVAAAWVTPRYFHNPANGKKQPVPRHNEIDDRLAAHIRKFLGL